MSDKITQVGGVIGVLTQKITLGVTTVGPWLSDTAQFLYQYGSTLITNPDGTRSLKNEGTGDDALLRTGTAYKSTDSCFMEAVDGPMYNTSILRTHIKAEAPTDNDRLIGCVGGNTKLRWGVTTNNEWRIIYWGGNIIIPRTRDYATFMAILVDRTSYIFLDGEIVNGNGYTHDSDLTSSGHEFHFIGYRANGSNNTQYSLPAYIGNSWAFTRVAETLTLQDAQAIALADYADPESSIYSDNGSVASDIDYISRNLSDNNMLLNWFPMMRTSGSSVQMITKDGSSNDRAVTGATGSEWQLTPIASDYQRFLVDVNPNGDVYGKSPVTLSVQANSFGELSSWFDTYKYDFAMDGLDIVLQTDLINLPAAVDWSADNYYISPAGDDFTGLGTEAAPFGSVDKLIDIIDKYTGDHVTNPVTVYLMDGEHDGVTFDTTYADKDFKGVTIRKAPNATNVVWGGLTIERTGHNLNILGDGITYRKNTKNIIFDLCGHNHVGDCTGIVIDGGEFTADENADLALWTESHLFYNNEYTAVSLDFTDGCTVTNLNIEGCFTGINCTRSKNATITNNHGSLFTGDFIRLIQSDTGYNTGLTVTGNVITDAIAFDRWHSDSIQAVGTLTNCDITGNIVLPEVRSSFGRYNQTYKLHEKSRHDDTTNYNGLLINDPNYSGLIDSFDANGYALDAQGGFINILSSDTGQAQGIFLSDGRHDNVTVSNNVAFAESGAHKITIANPRNCTIVNNTASKIYIEDKYGDKANSTNNVIANNLTESALQTTGLAASGNTIASNVETLNLLTDVVDGDATDGAYNFSLVTNIPGDAAYAPTLDIDYSERKDPPNVGAYECRAGEDPLVDADGDPLLDADGCRLYASL